jgi:hypothetical protein
MPETAFTKVTTAGFGEGIVDAGYEAVDQPNGNKWTNTGREVLLVANGSGGNVVLTLNVPAGDRTYNKAYTKTFTVAAGDTGVFGPFPPSVYNQSDQTVTVAWDTGTSITAAVVDLTPAK